jgi:hypothetical protein
MDDRGSQGKQSWAMLKEDERTNHLSLFARQSATDFKAIAHRQGRALDQRSTQLTDDS